MTVSQITIQPANTMSYSYRLATPADAQGIAPLMASFAENRESIDPSMLIKPNFDFEKYVTSRLTKPLSYCWLLEENNSQIVGVLFVYYYDEAPPRELPEYLIEQQELENPFQPRRVGSVLAMYIQPEHRKPENIKLLIKAALQQAEEMKVSDLDLLIAADQTGIQEWLQRAGFTRAAVQYTRHYDLPQNLPLPSLHPPHPQLAEVSLPEPSAIPLRHPQTQELALNPQGEPIFLRPLRDDQGKLLFSSSNTPIYPTPLCDPQTHDWVLDQEGFPVICPPVWDENKRILEHQGIPQFHPPCYQLINGKIGLQKNSQGDYLFADLERDKEGKILRTPDGLPIFKSYP